MKKKTGARSARRHHPLSTSPLDHSPLPHPSPTHTHTLQTNNSWGFFFLFGHIRDAARALAGRPASASSSSASAKKAAAAGLAPIRQDYEDFYTRRMFYRIHDCWNRPIGSAPDAYFDVLERTPVRGQAALDLTGQKIRALNLGSYNYLGFAAADPYCTPRVQAVLASQGWAVPGTRADAGNAPIHAALEAAVAAFVRKPAAVVFGMGFATNSAVIPALVGRGCLVISDALNHASIVAGVRGSGAKVAVFAHNDVDDLEAVLRRAIAHGQPRTRRPWRKVFIIVEGVYSMEGEMPPLPEIVALKRKYKAYLYVDEAHSIGALGETGRGVCEHFGVDPADVDILMGTFTKAFGAAGGYIAGSADLIAHIKAVAPGHLQATAMAPPVAEQVLAALALLTGADGSDRGARKLAALRDNANYLRRRLLAMGANVLGDWDSPVAPVMLFQPGKIAAFSRACLERGLAVVVVGFPATPLLTARARLCASAAHTRADLDYALSVLGEAVSLCRLAYRPRRPVDAGEHPTHHAVVG
jgi:serine palmitoyltransferase